MLQKLRSLSSDTAVYGISTILGRFLSFLLTPLYTNYVSQAELGEITYLFGIIAFVNVIYSFGLESSFFRFYSREDKRITQDVYSSAIGVIGCVSGILTILFLIFAPMLSEMGGIHSGATPVRYAALIAFVDALLIIPFASLRMRRKSRHFATLKFLMIAVNVAANLLFVVALGKKGEGVFLSGVVSSSFGLLIFIPSILKNFRPVFNRALLREMFAFGVPTIPAGFSAIILQVADRPILMALTDSATVGFYQVNYKLGIPMMMAVTVFEYAWKPFFLGEAHSPEAKKLFARIFTYFTLVCALIFLTTSFFVEFLVQFPFIGGRFIHPSYWGGLVIVPIVLGGYYFNGVVTNLAAGAYIEKQTKFLPLITGIAAIVNAVLLLVFVPIWGVVGAAFATLAAYFVSAVAMYRFSRKIYPIRYEWRRVGAIIILTLAVFFGIKALPATLGILPTLGIRTLGILLLPTILAFIGVFRTEELGALRSMFTRKR